MATALRDDGDVHFATLDAESPRSDGEDTGATFAAPIPAQSSSDPIASSANSCRLTAKFISIPSGPLPCTLMGDVFGAPFSIRAEFGNRIPCTCACGEYRQFIRGTIKRNGKPMIHQICSTAMHPTIWREDCAVSSKGVARSMGHRSFPPGTNDKFTPDQAIGCNYSGFDHPGFRLSVFKSGDVLEQHIEFDGQLVDACNSDAVLTRSLWSIDGTITVP